MSILIKGMEMPKNCWECLCNDLCGAIAEMGGACPFTERVIERNEFDAHSGIHPDCPLVEIPPHGRLIDGAALKTKLNNIHDFLLGDCEFSELATSDKARIDELTNCIAEVVNAATVIESEVEE